MIFQLIERIWKDQNIPISTLLRKRYTSSHWNFIFITFLQILYLLLFYFTLWFTTWKLIVSFQTILQKILSKLNIFQKRIKTNVTNVLYFEK